MMIKERTAVAVGGHGLETFQPWTPDRGGEQLAAAVEALHDEVEQAFARFELADGGRSRQYRALLAISDAMAAHTTVEQELLHPALREQTARHEDAVEHQLERQHLMDLLLVELGTMIPGERRYEAKVRLLLDLFRQHTREQGQTLLPALQRHLDPGERHRLAEDVRAYARELREPARV